MSAKIGNKNGLKHGMSGTRIYETYKAMLSRCFYKKHPSYHRYGGRGITVCKRWMKFENFLKDMGAVPIGEKRMTLDRINNNGNYCPRNCKWSTYLEQARNRSTCRKIKGKTISEWSESLCVSRRTVIRRYNKGKL